MNNVGPEASEKYLRAVTLSKIRMGQLSSFQDLPSGFPSGQPRVRVPLIDSSLSSDNDLTGVEALLGGIFCR